MRHRIIVAAVLAVLAADSCMKRDGLSLGSRPREGTESGKSPHEGGTEMTEEGPDTVLYVCGVEPAGGYDWVRDTLAGAYEGKIVLFESTGGERKGAEFRRILEIRAGPRFLVNPEPDMHHLLGGHVYTEYSDSRTTCLGRDGKELFRFEGRACLRGLLEGSDGFLYSLWMDRSGTGISLRKESEILFSRSDAIPFGGFNGPDRSRTGGLYERGGTVCCAWMSNSTGGRTFFIGRGQEQTQVFLPVDFDTVEDLKVAGEAVCAVGRKDGAVVAVSGPAVFQLSGKRTVQTWNDIHILELAGGAFVAARLTNARKTSEMVLWSVGDDAAEISGRAGNILLHDGERSVEASVPPGSFCNACGGGTFCGRRVSLALTPVSPAPGSPFIRTGETDTEVPLNGFLTGAEYIIKH